MKNIHLAMALLLVSGHLASAGKPASVQYIFPMDRSKLISRSCEIIVRPGEEIDGSSLSPDFFTVVGEKSGRHTGTVILATDNKTVIFKPDRLYAPAELVSVTVEGGLKIRRGGSVPSFRFTFQVTPLAEPLNPYDYRAELNPMRLPKDLPVQGLKKAAVSDSFPQGFPTFSVVANGEPGAGDFYFSPTRFISGDGYNLRVSNTGDVVYYKKIEEGVPFDFKVLPNGMLSFGVMSEFYDFGGGGPTEFYMMDSTYTVFDHYQMGNGYIADFHEFTYLPNGHVYMLTYDVQPIDMTEFVPNGHSGALVAGSTIQELDRAKNVIFQWRSWDHYKLTDSYADLTQTIFDAIHINSIELDKSDGQLIISTLALGEATKINRQTGEIIWRMGGKNNEFTFIDESQAHAPLYFMFQHEIRRLPNGNITIFDGGDRERREYSRVVEYAIDEEKKTATKVWEFRKNPDVYSPNMGSAQRLPNGNTVIGWGLASMYGLPAITEVDPQGDIVFELTFDKPLTASYRALKFDWDGGRPVADVTVSELLAGNTYEFERGDQKTGLTIRVNEKDGFGYNEAVAELYNYGPLVPEFVTRAPLVQQRRIVLSQFNIPAIRADLMFDVDFYGLDNPEGVLIYHREFEGRGLFLPLTTVYNPATNQIEAKMTKFGEFILTYPDLQSEAFPPLTIQPGDGEMVDQTKPVRLEWTPVGYTTEYTFQVARDAAFADLVVEEQYVTDAVYDLSGTENNAAYYWRVKAYNDVGESDWCPTATFETKAPYITLKTPDASSKWQRGLEYFITWEDIIREDVILELYKSEAYVMVIDTTASTGGYKWNIPLFLDAGSDYKIKIRSIDNPAVSAMSASPFTITDESVDVEKERAEPRNFELSQNYPNPFNPSTRIAYHIAAMAHVTLKVYDIRGAEVATLVDEVQAPNSYLVEFAGQNLSTGIYVYRLHVGDRSVAAKKMLFVK